MRPSEVATYIGGMAGELRRLAISADMGFVAYLLGMVEEEAKTNVPLDAQSADLPGDGPAEGEAELSYPSGRQRLVD